MRLVWVNEERTVMVESFVDEERTPGLRAMELVGLEELEGLCVALRGDPSETWGPPVECRRVR